MPAKVTDPATGYEEIDRWNGGVGWIAHPEETMERASHALATDEGVWLVDPVDADGIDDLLGEFGEVAGVVVLSNHHTRDAAVFANRHGVPVTLPASMTDVAGSLDAPVAYLDVGGTVGDYELLEVADSGPAWREYALYDGETLVVSESVGGADYLRVGDERLGVMLLRRLTPPREAFADLSPERVLSGHGPGVHEDAAPALAEALTYSRRRFPSALLANGRSQLRTVAAAIRT
ncbi:hypothetical protein HWV07_18695 [Natronomonas salina]|uniref:hypothetical protein n=1 Tax=Natronomonas salina TaxID=1710540 RepID=UPI0015B5FC82|nr:hypothetical protein [Natronomonas salina]QLD90964.1 hypothetical protein HWV07_18695 [Natronomonas salina]